MDLLLASIWTAAILIALLLPRLLKSFSPQPRLPPGPSALPIVGNIHQLPLDCQEQTFLEWGRQYGDIIYARLFHRPTIITSSVHVARDLLEKKSANFSDRPPLILLQDLLGWRGTTAAMAYGESFKKHRRWMHQALAGRDALRSFQPLQRRETHVLLASLLETPEAYATHVLRFIAAILAEITYGRKISGVSDRYVLLAERALADTVEAGSPGSNLMSVLVDFFPVLQYYPLWLPGSRFRVKAQETKRIVDSLKEMPFDAVREQMASGIARPSVVANLLEELQRENSLTSENIEDVKGVAAGLYGAGADTSTATLTSFLLNMVRNPQVFKKAQQEMDSVVGRDRLPDFDDREALPYLQCIIKEVYRWTAPVALAIPHASMGPDEYRGYYIPENVMVIPNIWGMCHDKDVFSNPEEFRPERFLDGLSEDNDPANIIFGFGRRKCPGQQIADGNIFLVAASLIATMDISKAKDENGNEITPPREINSGFVRHPGPFPFSIRPRSQQAVDLILQANLNTST